MSVENQSEMEKMIAGQYYNPADPELMAKRSVAREITQKLQDLPYDNWVGKRNIYRSFFGATGQELFIEQPFICDYGFNIYWGDQVYVNFGCIFLDSAPIHIGCRVLIAPSVQFFTATHPIDYKLRNSGLEYGKSITIGDDVWLGGGSIINPGVTVGDRSVIGSGSVVTGDIPSDVVAVGNPARILRSINNEL